MTKQIQTPVDNDALLAGQINGPAIKDATPAPSTAEPATGFFHIPVDELEINSQHNLRRFMPDQKALEEFAKTIIAEGQLQPIGVSQRGAVDKPYRVIFGYRRSMAIEWANSHMKELGLKAPLKVLARVISPTEEMEMVFNLSENENRKELSWIDRAHSIDAFKKGGMKGIDIAARFKKSSSWVTQVCDLLSLPIKFQKMVHEDKCPFNVARSMVGLPEEQAEKQWERFQNGMSRMDLEKHREQALDTAEGGRKKKKRKKVEPKSGKPLSIKGALHVFEEAAVLPKEVDGKAYKPRPVEASRVEVVKLVLKLMAGKMGAQAFVNQLEKVLG